MPFVISRKQKQCNEYGYGYVIFTYMTHGHGKDKNPDSKVHEAYMGPTWGRQDPGGSHVDLMILAI